MELPIYNYPTLGLACHWHAICQQLAACTGIIEDLQNNEKEGMVLVEKEREKLENILNNNPSEFLRKNTRKDIRKLDTINASREFMILTLLAVHNDAKFHEYCSFGAHRLCDIINQLYDIPINSSEMIMLDSAKIYEYLLKYFVKKETLYVSTDNNVRSTEEAIRKYKPKYILIPVTELHANSTFKVDDVNYHLISASKGSGHFYCDHIVGEDAYQFDDRTPKTLMRKHTLANVLEGIRKSEVRIPRRCKFLKEEVINELEKLSEKHLDKEYISSDGLLITIKEIFGEKELKKDDALSKFSNSVLLTDIINQLKDDISWASIVSYIENHEDKYYSNELFIKFHYDSLFYGMAMLIRDF